MSINGLGYHNCSYVNAALHTAQRHAQKTQDIQKGQTNQSDTFAKGITTVSDSVYGNAVLLCKDALIAIAHPQTGESVNVFRAENYAEDHPVYLVKGTDASGSIYEQTINVNEVDPENCSYTELLVLNAHTGHNKDSDFLSMGRMRDSMEGKSIFERCNYLAGAQELMKEQKTLGNWEGYLKYQKWIQDILDFEDTVKDKKSTDKEEQSQTKSNIIVRADGSRDLMLETMVGGIKSVMNIELSKPTDKINEINGSNETSEINEMRQINRMNEI